MRAALAAMAILTCLLPVAASPASQPIYVVGQVWKYHTRPGDTSSLLRIADIDVVDVKPARTIHHSSVIGVHLGATGTATTVKHLSESQETLGRSVIELTNSDAPAMTLMEPACTSQTQFR